MVVRQRISEKTRIAYDGSVRRFRQWIVEHHPDLLDAEAVAWDRLSIGVLQEYFTACLNRTDEEGRPAGLSPSAMTVIRSAIKFQYEELGLALPENYDRGLKDLFKGLGRIGAQRRREGVTEEEAAARGTGKEPLPFEVYRILCRAMLRGTRPDSSWPHCFAVLSWNLVCRANNTAAIMLSRMRWRGDALCIFFAYTKTDQGGERPKDPMHIYANPLMPEICPILSLGIRFLTFAPGETGALFPSTNAMSRFSKRFSSVLAEDDVQAVLGAMGMRKCDFATHSFRKGAGTYCVAGSTASPNIMAISTRAGWKCGKVPEKYLRYESAGDQYVGRTVAGLPIHSASFATLPPRFRAESEAVTRAVAECFSPHLVAMEHLQPVLRMCLASVVFHAGFIEETMYSRAPVRIKPPLGDPAMMEALRAELMVGPGEDGLEPTGIPPHVTAAMTTGRLVGAVEGVREGVDAIPDRTAERVEPGLEQRC